MVEDYPHTFALHNKRISDKLGSYQVAVSLKNIYYFSKSLIHCKKVSLRGDNNRSNSYYSYGHWIMRIICNKSFSLIKSYKFLEDFYDTKLKNMFFHWVLKNICKHEYSSLFFIHFHEKNIKI